MDAPETIERQVESVRRFSRFYTRQIGVLGDGMLGSPYSLAEARVLFELAQRGETTASALGADLGLDQGYLSRLLRKLREQRLVARRPAESDARQRLLQLSADGEAAFATLNAASQRQVHDMLAPRTAAERQRLVGAMRTIEDVLGRDSPARSAPAQLLLRPHQPGDIGWIVDRHAVLYTEEYGWDESFEALVAEIAAGFLRAHDPRRERCWIAEKDGERAGSVMCVQAASGAGDSAGEAKLRLLLVEPDARGLGLGRRLVDECIRFVRRVGYRKLSLFTVDALAAARRIYLGAGFRLVREEPGRRFGKDLVGQYWELGLG